MVRIGLFGVFEGEDALTGAILRAELARRIPGLELRVYTPAGRSQDPGFAELVPFSDQPLGACTPARQEELAATLDAVVIAGSLPLDAPAVSAERLLVEGLGAFEPDVPVAWFAVSTTRLAFAEGRPAAGLERRTAMWVVGHDAVDRLEALGADPERLEVVPHPALALPRVAPAADMPEVVERLRAASTVPAGDYIALDETAPEGIPNGVRLPPVGDAPRWTPLERGAAIAMSAAYVGDSRAACAIAASYGRPALWTGSAEDVPRFAVARGGADAAAAVARTHAPDAAHVEEALGELDAAFDALAAFLTVMPAEDRVERTLRVRLREESAAAAAREADLRAWAERLEGELVDEGPRFAALWRRLHEGDRHYNWHKTRADRAEAELQILWREHESSLAMRAKRTLRSTKLGDAAARALGAGPLQPPPVPGPAEEPDA
jgi:hypothetical protein